MFSPSKHLLCLNDTKVNFIFLLVYLSNRIENPQLNNVKSKLLTKHAAPFLKKIDQELFTNFLKTFRKLVLDIFQRDLPLWIWVKYF